MSAGPLTFVDIPTRSFVSYTSSLQIQRSALRVAIFSIGFRARNWLV